MLALSIRQPYVELILRGIKTVEYRSKPTKIIGQRFWIYAAKKLVSVDTRLEQSPTANESGCSDHQSAQFITRNSPISSDNLSSASPPPWILELAMAMKLFGGDAFDALPRGLIVGSAVIEKIVRCELQIGGSQVLKSRTDSSTTTLQSTTIYQWHLTDVETLKVPMKPARQPQPIWFRPFELGSSVDSN